MRNHAEPARAAPPRSPAPAGREAAALQRADGRDQAVAQARLDALAQSGPRMAQLRALQSKADAGLARAGGLAVLQRQSASDEDEAQQAKFPATQRATQEASPPAGPAPETATQSTREAAAKPNSTGLPDGLKSGVESLSGMSLDHVRVHYASPQPARLNAHAYTQGGDIHVAPGQERHLPHEAWHVVQQAQGRVRPTRQMKGGVPINDDRGLEREADAMGARAAQRAPAQAAARAPNGAAAGPQGACVQRWSLSSAWDSVKSVGRGIADVAGSVVDAAAKGIGWLKDKALGWVAEHAESIPGFHLLAVAVGRNPVTGHAVERSAMNVTRGVMGLIPGGDKLFKQLQESGALERAFAWLSEQIETLNLGWDAIRGLFGQAWDALSMADVTSPSRAFEKIKAVFAPPLTRIENFALAVGKKVLEFVVEGALRLAGPAGQQVMDIFRRGKETLMLIVSDPVGFARNLIQAVVQGMKQFGANIWTHLKKGLTGWLFGTLTSAGLTLPEKFDLKGILSLVLQILGLTYQHLRKKLVKLMGEKNVKRVEQAVEFVTLLVTEGIGAAWQKIVEYIGNLKDTVLGAIKDWVVTKIVTAALTKIATMFNPVGAVIQAVIAAYNTVMFFVERAKQIMALVDSVIDSIGQIAQGKIGAAANYVEETMARTIPVILSFLARLLGLSGLDEKIRKIIETIQGKVEAALDKVVEFIREKAKAVLAWGKAGVGKATTAIGNWWNKRYAFTTKKGKKHQLYFERRGGKLKLIMASTPAELLSTLMLWKTLAMNGSATVEMKKQVSDIEFMIDHVNSIKVDESSQGDDFTERDKAALKIIATYMRDRLMPIFEDAVASDKSIQEEIVIDSAEADIEIYCGAVDELLETARRNIAKCYDRDHRRVARQSIEYYEMARKKHKEIEDGVDPYAELVPKQFAVTQREIDVNAGFNVPIAKPDRAGPTYNLNAAKNTSSLASAAGLNKEKSGSGVGKTRPAGWSKFVAMIGKSNNKYVQGHSLSQRLGGPGKQNNLSPFTRSLNGLHSARVEQPIIGFQKLKDHFLQYTVTVNYGGNPNIVAKSLAQFNGHDFDDKLTAMTAAGVITPAFAAGLKPSGPIPQTDLDNASKFIADYVNAAFPGSITCTVILTKHGSTGAGFVSTATQTETLANKF